jgi:hypothetical protein
MGLYPKQPAQIASRHILKFFFYLLVAEWMWVVLSGCSPRKQVIQSETVYKETYRDTTIYIQGEIVQAGFTDSFLNELKSKFKSDLKDTVRIVSRNGSAELRVWIDQFGQMQASCEAKDREIALLLKEIEKNNKHIEMELVEKKNPYWLLILAVCFSYVGMGIIIMIFKR